MDSFRGFIPTRKGFCLRPAEYLSGTKTWSETKNNLPAELTYLVFCYEKNDPFGKYTMLGFLILAATDLIRQNGD